MAKNKTKRDFVFFAIGYQDNILRIKYQGACGGCPSAMFGTLQMIEGVLKDKFDDIVRYVKKTGKIREENIHEALKKLKLALLEAGSRTTVTV